jgi:protein ImuB
MDGHSGDARVARALVDAAHATGWAARVGIAGCCVAAAAATHERGRGIRVVPAGRERAYLHRVPLALLPIGTPTRDALSLLGVRDCGALAALPPAEVELRLGRDGLEAWRLARGEDARWPFRPPPPEGASAAADFDPPLEDAEPLRFVLGGLIAQVVAQLAARQRLPGTLRLRLRTAGADDARMVAPARATADPRLLGDLCRRAVEERPLPGPLRGVTLESITDGVPRADQLDAFTLPAPDPGAVHAALLPVFARWGEGALSRAEHEGGHLPGEHAAWVAEGPGGIDPLTAHRPPRDTAAEPGEPSFRNVLTLCLRRLSPPLRAEVQEDAGHRPIRVRLETAANVLYDAGMGTFPQGVWRTLSAGPERISGRWWGCAGAREYWRVEAPDGWLGLLYREAVHGGWYLEGWYD